MRYHEFAMQAWLYSHFYVREGYPVPVVFGTPMDAFSKFKDLWAKSTNPFNYLFDLKDENGTPLYEPHPAVPRYPLISVSRKGWKYRTSQNYSIHQWRRLNWPTVADDVKREDLGYVTVSDMPMAWDYRFQITFYSTRPDTQAFFIESFMREFNRTGGTPQTWLPISYPGIGNHLIRLFMADESIEWETPEEPEPDKIMEYRTSINVTLEGYSIDARFRPVPALWTLIIGGGPATVDELTQISPIVTDNLRIGNNNPVLDDRANVPANGTNAQPVYGQPITSILSFGTGTPSTADPTYFSPSSYTYGIVSSEVFGNPVVVTL
jgi:hypothetical protein